MTNIGYHDTPAYYKTVFGSPVMHVMPYAWVDLIENDYIYEFSRPFEYDEEAFAILDDNDNLLYNLLKYFY